MNNGISNIKSFEDFIKEMGEEKASNIEKFCVEKLKNWETAKRLILPKLINYEWNKEMLKDRTHVRVFDGSLAVTFYFRIDDEGCAYPEGDLEKMWGVNKYEIYGCAMENMERILEPEFINMGPMIVITNAYKKFGAAMILSKSIQEEILGKWGPVYLLPSSIHEWIILPIPEEHTKEDRKELIHLVRDVNEDHVSIEEWLADTIWMLKDERGPEKCRLEDCIEK